MTNISIIKAKLNIPKPREGYIVRDKLFNKLLKLTKYKLTLIKAGAGSGKTTLLSSYIDKYKPINIKWISLDTSDNDFFVFWTYFFELIKGENPDRYASLEEVFNNNMDKRKIFDILIHLINEIDRSKDLTLIFDDFHLVKDQFLLDTIDFFINNMPNNIHLVFISREISKLSLAKLIMDDQVMIIEEEEIKFSKEECREFLNRSIKTKKDEKEIERLVEKSGGWIGGLQLLILSENKDNIPSMFNSSVGKQVLDKYLHDEVFTQFNKETQEFLIETAILRYFNHEIYNKYKAKSSFYDRIEDISNRNLFILNVDENGYYRYHGIFSEFLGLLFKKMDYDKQKALYKRAADVYLEIGDYSESIYHMFLIPEYDRIMELMMDKSDSGVNYAYFDKIPIEMIATNLECAIQYFFYSYSNRDEATCIKIYKLLEKNFSENDSFRVLGDVYAYLTNHKILINADSITMKQIFGFKLNTLTTATLLIDASNRLVIMERYNDALTYLDKASELIAKNDNPYIKYYELIIRAQAYEGKGELKKAILAYDKIKGLKQISGEFDSNYTIAILGIYIQKLSLDEAKNSLEIIKDKIEEGGALYKIAYYYNYGEYLFALGDYESSANIMLELMEYDISKSPQYAVKILKIPIYLSKVSKRDIIQYMELYMSEETGTYSDFICALSLYKLGDFEKALDILDRIIVSCRKFKNKYKLIEALLLKTSIILEHDKKLENVMNMFIEAIVYGSENDILLPFCFEKEAIKMILSLMELEVSKELSDLELEFLNRVKEIVYNQTIKDLSKIKLSARENEVLLEMANGKSNQEIAEELHVSLATVKSHIIKIYSKLGVHNRVAAINKGLKK